MREIRARSSVMHGTCFEGCVRSIDAWEYRASVVGLLTGLTGDSCVDTHR